MNDREKITRFIDRFRGCEDVFLKGCCYWFAHILNYRFDRECDADIMYEPVEGHFITRIDNHFYDARGDVTELYRGKPMYDIYELRRENSKLYDKLMRECRDFREVEEDAG
jgi:hypothetical protein